MVRESHSKEFHTIDEVRILRIDGSWKTKSGGHLEVMLALPQEEVIAFLDYNNPAFDKVPHNLRGLRVYTVKDIPEGAIGANEWHKIRTEVITVIDGRATLRCVDMIGQEREFYLDGNQSIVIPPTLMHTYHATENRTRLQVITNTLFDPNDPSTQDTFSMEEFVSSSLHL